MPSHCLPACTPGDPAPLPATGDGSQRWGSPRGARAVPWRRSGCRTARPGCARSHAWCRWCRRPAAASPSAVASLPPGLRRPRPAPGFKAPAEAPPPGVTSGGLQGGGLSRAANGSAGGVAWGGASPARPPPPRGQRRGAGQVPGARGGTARARWGLPRCQGAPGPGSLPLSPCPAAGGCGGSHFKSPAQPRKAEG